MMEGATGTRFGVRDATHLYSGVPALQDVSFELDGGSVHGLVGENGSGKSTLIKVLTGALRPSAGTLYLAEGGNEREVSFSLPANAQADGIGVVHQDYHLFPDLTVAANVLGISESPPRRRWSRTVDKRALDARVHGLLESLGVDLRADRMVRDLGAAERKFVEIARAMLLKPKFLILDEPTASLEPQASNSVLELLERLRTQGVGLCFISHRLDEVLRIADRVSVLRDGRMVTSAANDGLTEAWLAEQIMGRKPEAMKEEIRQIPHQIKLSVQDLELRPGRPPVRFAVRKGEIFGLTGLLGSGAAEIVSMIGGAKPLRGELSVDGASVRIKTPRDASAAGIGYIPEDRKATGLVPDQSIAVNISLASLSKVAGALGWVRRKLLRERGEEYRTSLDIRTRSVEAPVRSLSGGNQQKVMLAKWLASGVQVIAVEEPTHGIDIGGKVQVHDLLQGFAAAGGTIVIASTDVHEVLAVCDRIGVMRHGALVELLDRKDLTSQKLAVIGATDASEVLESLVEVGTPELATGSAEPIESDPDAEPTQVAER